MEDGEEVVSATFVTPYPPGFPVLVPGQMFSQRDPGLTWADLDTSEVHGYRADRGYRVYTDAALRQDEPVAAQVLPERRKSGRRKRSAYQPLTAAGDTPGGS